MPDRPLDVTGLGHAYGDTAVLDGVDLAVDPGEFVSLLGPSGCGKSTLLRAVAGLVTPRSGRIAVGGRVVVEGGHERVPAERRRVGLVFQDYALFPALTVRDNALFGTPSGPDDQARVDRLLALAGLAELAGRRPHQLSGGQQQRAALVRALAPQPALLLLDEPFANIDATMRHTIGVELRRLARAAGASVLLVTHDRGDALGLSDRVVVLGAPPRGGPSRVAQDAPPATVWARPNDATVAGLTGDCWLIVGEANGSHVETDLGSLRLAQPRAGAVLVVLRPELIGFEPAAQGPLEVRDATFVGPGWRLEVASPAGPGVVAWPRADRPVAGTRGRLALHEPVWAVPTPR